VNDWILGAAWTAVLLVGFAGVVLLHRAGLPRTYARDLLHVGAGVWVLGWPWWSGPLVPLLIVWTALVATAAVPVLSSRSPLLRRAHDSVAGEGERWTGIVAYVLSFAVLTTLALGFGHVHPGACAVAALCAGDGLGGLVGRRWGRHRFRVPWSKSKTWEGSLAVGVFATLGIALAEAVLSFPIRWTQAIVLGTGTALAEALAPRASDNVVVPAAVFLLALLF
jgi:phytol kinase